MSFCIAKTKTQHSRLRLAVVINLVVWIVVISACSLASCAENSYADADGGAAGGSAGGSGDYSGNVSGSGSAGGGVDVGESGSENESESVISGSATYTEKIWDSIQNGETSDTSIASVGFTKLTGESAPSWFEDEIAPVVMFDAVYSDESYSLFELQISGELSDISKTMCETLEAKGWICTETEYEGVLTFNKTEGQCKWAVLECTQIDDECCIVLRVMFSG